MRLHLEKIGEHGVEIRFDEPVSAFSALEALPEDGPQLVDRVRGDVRLDRVGAMIEVTGQVQARLRSQCSRCLVPYEEEVTGTLELTLYPSDKRPEEALEDERELAPDELTAWVLESEEIDLHGPVAEQVLLALPVQPLCRKDCKGLCPRCGADLNKEDCNCSGNDFPGPFDALKNLKVDK